MALRDRWPLDDLDEVRDALLAAYADPSRGYHDTLHLSEVLDRLDELAAAEVAFDRVPVTLAAWFHDGVYDGTPGDEERSAQWAATALAGPGVGPGVGPEVARLVRVTEHHRPAADDTNGAALSDADLAILAAGPRRYQDYRAAVRREYAHVPDDLFAAGRLAVLRDLLAKPHLFHTAPARERWEEAARANVAGEVDVLEEGRTR